ALRRRGRWSGSLGDALPFSVATRRSEHGLSGGGDWERVELWAGDGGWDLHGGGDRREQHVQRADDGQCERERDGVADGLCGDGRRGVLTGGDRRGWGSG